ncbi:filamentous hemagglutinin N-terminal domain-containing protein [Xanthomonas sacchari]|uniref:two-partner secretion domain-containing protein n=1 Tax=Xanthomonas sacchari TaxID=56458 RepID=UPI002253F1E6|nr:filamentous hemagglutinin N-terminal domain-containing protein [Xanthomonas sacchari]
MPRVPPHKRTVDFQITPMCILGSAHYLAASIHRSRYMRKSRPILRHATLAASVMLINQAYATDNGVIAHGTATIDTHGSVTTVNQASDKLVINWRDMNVGKDETLNFVQKDATAAVLNRITSADPTTILGTLNANGRVFVVNPNGVLIGQGANLNVGSLVASSLDIKDDDFDADKLDFAQAGKGEVSNLGQIKARDSVALLGANKVRNDGTIVASGGTIVLAAADGIRLAFSGSNLQATLSQGSLQALVENGGLIASSNGDVVLTAWARDAIARSVINNTGTLEATTLDATAANGTVALRSLGNGEVGVGGTIATHGTPYDQIGIDVQGQGIAVQDGADLEADIFGNIRLTTIPTTDGAGYVRFGAASVGGGDLQIRADNVLTATDQAAQPSLSLVSATVDTTAADRGIVLGRALDAADAGRLHDGNGSISSGFVNAASQGSLAVFTSGKGDIVVGGKQSVGFLSLGADRGDIRLDGAISGNGMMAVTNGSIHQNAELRSGYRGVDLYASTLHQNADIVSDRGRIALYGSSQFQAEGVRTRGGTVTLRGDDLRLSGDTQAGDTLSITGDNVVLDGAASGGRLNLIAWKQAKTTERASLQASSASLFGGSFDLAQGSNALDNLSVSARSADIALSGDAAISNAYSSGDLRLRSQKGMTLSDASAGGILDVRAVGDLDVGTVHGQRDVRLAGSNVASTSGRYWWTPSSITTSGKVSVEAENDVRLNAITGWAIDINAGNGNANLGLLTSSGDISVNGASTVRVDNGYAGGNLRVTSQGDVTVGGSLSAGGNLTLGGKNIIANAAPSWWSFPMLQANGALKINANGNVAVNNVRGGSVDMVGAGGSVGAGQITSGGDVSVSGKRAASVAGISAGGKLSLVSEGDVAFSGALNARGDLLIGGHNVTAVPTGYYYRTTPSLIAGGKATVTAMQNATLGNVSAAALDLRANGGALIADRLDSAGTAYLGGGRGIVLNKRATSKGNLTLASQGDVTESDGVEVGGNLSYVLADSSKVALRGTPNKVAGTTSGINAAQTDDTQKRTPSWNDWGWWYTPWMSTTTWRSPY